MPGEPEKGISIAETDPQDAKEQSLGLQRLGRKSGKIPTSWLVDDCEERRQSLKEDKTLLSESGAPMMMTDQGLQTPTCSYLPAGMVTSSILLLCICLYTMLDSLRNSRHSVLFVFVCHSQLDLVQIRSLLN